MYQIAAAGTARSQIELTEQCLRFNFGRFKVIGMMNGNDEIDGLLKRGRMWSEWFEL